jgi:hypothetical protein
MERQVIAEDTKSVQDEQEWEPADEELDRAELLDLLRRPFGRGGGMDRMRTAVARGVGRPLRVAVAVTLPAVIDLANL